MWFGFTAGLLGSLLIETSASPSSLSSSALDFVFLAAGLMAFLGTLSFRGVAFLAGPFFPFSGDSFFVWMIDHSIVRTTVHAIIFFSSVGSSLHYDVPHYLLSAAPNFLLFHSATVQFHYSAVYNSR